MSSMNLFAPRRKTRSNQHDRFAAGKRECDNRPFVVPSDGHVLLLDVVLADLDGGDDGFAEQLRVLLLHQRLDVLSVRRLCGSVVLLVFVKDDLVTRSS